MPFLFLNEQLAEPTLVLYIAVLPAFFRQVKKDVQIHLMRASTRCLVPERGVNLLDSRPTENKALINAFPINASCHADLHFSVHHAL